MAVVGNEVATLVQVNVAVQLGLVCRRLAFSTKLKLRSRWAGQGDVFALMRLPASIQECCRRPSQQNVVQELQECFEF